MRTAVALPLLLVMPLAAGAAEAPSPCQEVIAGIARVTDDPAAPALVGTAVRDEIAKFSAPSWTPGFCAALADNFAAKVQSRREGVSFTGADVAITGVAFEGFRITAFRNAGVAPKRYFGFLDGKGLGGAYEQKLKAVAARVAPMLNDYARKKGLNITVTPKEIVVTHIAEGGALLLSSNFASADSVHPVSGVGLDDYRKGLKQYADLVAEIDAAFNTHLGEIAGNPQRPLADRIFGGGVVRRIEKATGTVAMNFEETVLGTAVMYLWEKAIAETKLKAEGRPSLASMPLDEQFVIASLVYNSGILFSDERIKQIMAFDTAAYLAETSAKSAAIRPALPVLNVQAADQLLQQAGPLPKQPTSWNAVYHILQRYGAWVALSRFSTVFNAAGQLATP